MNKETKKETINMMWGLYYLFIGAVAYSLGGFSFTISIGILVLVLTIGYILIKSKEENKHGRK